MSESEVLVRYAVLIVVGFVSFGGAAPHVYAQGSSPASLDRFNPQEWNRLETEDAVFAAVLDSLFGPPDSARRLVVRAMTTPGLIQERLPEVFRRSLEEFPALSPDAASDFFMINREPRQIEAIEYRGELRIVPDSVFGASRMRAPQIRGITGDGSASASEAPPRS